MGKKIGASKVSLFVTMKLEESHQPWSSICMETAFNRYKLIQNTEDVKL
jgi:hypothetical protein